MISDISSLAYIIYFLLLSVLDCQSSWGSGFKSWPAQRFGLKFLLHLSP